MLIGALDLRRGDQVLAVAVLTDSSLHLYPAADVLQQLTGTLPAETLPGITVTTPAAPHMRSRVAPCFTRPVGSG